MAKRKKGQHRKRISKDVPHKMTLKSHADKLWSIAVRSDWNWRCAICGSTDCQAHHLITRRYQSTRYELRCGISLCPGCHTFDGTPGGKGRPSAHVNTHAFDQWMRDHHPDIIQWVHEHAGERFDGTTNADYYIETIKRLKEYVDEDAFVRIVGVKFSRWLEESE